MGISVLNVYDSMPYRVSLVAHFLHTHASPTHAHAHIHTNTHIYAHTHTKKYAHTHTLSLVLFLSHTHTRKLSRWSFSKSTKAAPNNWWRLL